LPSEAKPPRSWRTRKDPFEEVWNSRVVPLLADDEDRVLEAKTILEELDKGRRPEEQFAEGQVRTLQRRIRDWRALHGGEREVFFEQEHPPGREGAIDFTNCNELGLTICGVPFAHLLFEFMLSFSTWTWICLARSETFEALVSGLQGALWALGGRPLVVRSDNLSAATHELQGGGRALTKRFAAMLKHFGDDFDSTRITPGNSNENGGVEQRHRRTKSMLKQALQLRGSKDFESEASYLAFARSVFDEKHNAKHVAQLAIERQHLKALPSSKYPEYSAFDPKVRCWSTISINKRAYSVPSRLIGHRVQVRQF
jgi:hypothetical protein